MRRFSEEGQTILCISHDLNLTATFFDHVAMLQAGTLAAVGPPSEIITRDLIRQVYRADVVIDRSPEGHPRITVTSTPPGGEGE